MRPLFGKSKSYSVGVGHIQLCTNFTELEATWQGPSSVMSLEGIAVDTILADFYQSLCTIFSSRHEIQKGIQTYTRS